jgi:phospholipid/cholesterol/gamma-HCH transport system ATP-binding protein
MHFSVFYHVIFWDFDMGHKVIELIDINNVYDEHTVHDNLNISLEKGEIVAVIGPSGCGKTTLLNTLLMLNEPVSGDVRLFDQDVYSLTRAELQQLRSRWGVLFQSGALFSSMTVIENIMYPLLTFTNLDKDMIHHIALIKLVLVGLSQEVAEVYPSSLSGGMVKRVAMARALALDPELIILDEPTAGLDPESACELDHLILQLHEYLNLTVLMITHDLETLLRVPSRICFMGEGKIIASATLLELFKMEHPLIKQYFSSDRAQHLLQIRGKNEA